MKKVQLELGMIANVQVDGKRLRLLVCKRYGPEGEGYAGIDVRKPLGKRVLANMGDNDALLALAPAARKAYVRFFDTQIT